MSVQHHMKTRQLDNRARIISELGKEDLMFKELLHKLGVAKGTLSSHLKKLTDEGKIQKQYSPEKKAVVYSVLPHTILREIIIHDFVTFIGSRVTEQILRKEMKEISEIDMQVAFPYGTVEDFFERRYKMKQVTYREILDILKDEYGPWIEAEGVDDEF